MARKAKKSRKKPVKCQFGKLKNPVGKRVCKKRPGGRKKRK